MVRMNFIFIFISSSDPNLLRKKSVKQKIKKNSGLTCYLCHFQYFGTLHVNQYYVG